MIEGRTRCKGERIRRIEEYRAKRPSPECLIGGRRNARFRAERGEAMVSVVTVCFNAVSTLTRAIRSVTNQSYGAMEYIVIDGGSTDGTLDLLRSHDDLIDIWISERDEGISDAFNKGIAVARGEFVILVNADDWLEREHLRIAVTALRERGADYVFGNLVIHSPDGAEIGSYIGDGAYERVIRHIMPAINHPTVVCRKAAYEKYGMFDTSLRCAMDYEWLLRAHILGGRGAYVPELVSHMFMDGRSDRFFALGLAEVRKISISYGYPFVPAWLRFAFRLGKGYARRGLEGLLPRRVFISVRSAVNGSFRRSTR